MEGTNISYPDSNINHDHTYYGNGCSNTWKNEPPYNGGSSISCTTRLVKDGNNENQKNGTYYTFQAITDGTGGILATSNTNSPDTFCPFGWQLPYSGTGGAYYDKSRSWNVLFNTYGIGFDDGTTADVAKVKSYPLSYVYSGSYSWGNGSLYYHNIHGLYWSSTLLDSTTVYGLSYSSYIRPAYATNKASGDTIRCDCRISNLESSPWHPRSLISIMAFHFLKTHFPSVKIMSNYLKNEA